MAYQETFVQRDQHRIYVRDHPGAGPPIILMHGFPELTPLRPSGSLPLTATHIVLFAFLGSAVGISRPATLTHRQSSR